MNNKAQFVKGTEWFLRIALAAAYLSAVADRFGMWGPPGSAGVAWGSWEAFVEYVAMLNWYVPAALHGALGWITTIAEIVIAIGLMIGWQLRWFALASGALLFIFAVSMMSAHGLKVPLDYSVLTASAASLYLAAEKDESG